MRKNQYAVLIMDLGSDVPGPEEAWGPLSRKRAELLAQKLCEARAMVRGTDVQTVMLADPEDELDWQSGH